MLNVFGKNYYIDIEEIIRKCRVGYGTEGFDESPTPKVNENGEQILELNIFKFEVFKSCVERLLSEYEDVDEKLGYLSEDGMSLSFKIAYNTLLKYEILVEDDGE